MYFGWSLWISFEKSAPGRDEIMGIRSQMSWSEKGHKDSSFNNDHQGDISYFRMHVHDMVVW